MEFDHVTFGNVKLDFPAPQQFMDGYNDDRRNFTWKIHGNPFLFFFKMGFLTFYNLMLLGNREINFFYFLLYFVNFTCTAPWW